MSKSHKAGDAGPLLASMGPAMAAGEFVFCTGTEAPAEAVCLFREAEGITAILPRPVAEARGLAYTYPCRMITLTVHSSLEAVGFLAAIAEVLAEHGISVNVVSAYHHDHLFVPSDLADEAMAALEELRLYSRDG